MININININLVLILILVLVFLYIQSERFKNDINTLTDKFKQWKNSLITQVMSAFLKQ